MMSHGDIILATEVATEATSLWALRQHDAALQTLQRLEGLLPNDPKVQVNELLTGYYADSSVTIDSLCQQLVKWLESNKQQGNTYYTAYKTAAINYGILLFVQQQHSKALDVLEPLYSNVEAMHGGAALCLCVLLLEIYLDSHQLPKAAQVLQYLQAFSAPGFPSRAYLSEDIAGEAGSGHTGDAEQLQQHLHLQQLDSPSQGRLQQSPQQSAKQQAAYAASPNRILQGQSPKQVQKQLPDPLQAGQPPALQVDQQPTSPVTLDAPMVTRCTSAFMQQVAQVVEQQGGHIHGMDVAATLHTYKARLAMACSNYKAAKKEVKALLALQPSSSSAMLMKSQLEVLRQQPKKALKTLAPILAAVGDCSVRCRLQLLTVLAAIHHQLGKHHVAALYLSTALSQHQQAYSKQQGPLSLQNTSSKQSTGKQKQQRGGKNGAAKGSRQLAQQANVAAAGTAEDHQGPRESWELLADDSDVLHYNMGLQQLMLQNFKAALECFEAAACSYYMQPQLWLRMAEASISLYHSQQQQGQQLPDHHQQQRQLPVLVQVGQPASNSIKSSRSSSSSEGSSNQARTRARDAAAAPEAGSGTVLLQQAAEQLSTGLALLRQQQAEAAMQAEEAAAAVTAAAVAAAAAGDQQSLAALTGDTTPVPGMEPRHGMFAEGSTTNCAASATAVGDPALGTSSDAAAASALVHDTACAGGVACISQLGACRLLPGTPALQQALLANQAYVHLFLQQPREALEAARALLACSSMSPQQHYLGSCYAAEALCMLGHTDEAAEQLQGHVALYMSSSGTGKGGSTAGLAAAEFPCRTAAHQQQQQHLQLGGLVAATDGGSYSSAAEHQGASRGTPAHAAAAPAIRVDGCGVATALPTHAGSIVSDDDGSCIGCKSSSSNVCGLGLSQAGHNCSSHTQHEQHVTVLCNMGSVYAAQGDAQESKRFAAVALAKDSGCMTAQMLLGAAYTALQ